MKYSKFLGLAMVMIGILTFGWVQVVHAHSFRTGSNSSVGQAEKVDNTLFVAGQNVDINTEVFGDVFCAGQTITVTGTVHGDVICAGQTVTVTGKVDGDVRLAAQTVLLGAEVGGNATVGAQSFTMQSTTKIGGDMSLGATTAALNGSIGRDLAVGSSNLDLNGSIGRNIKGTVETMTLASSARVAGNIEYGSDKDLQKVQGAVVGGKVTRTELPKRGEPKRGAVFGFSILWFFYWLGALLFAAMALVLLFPRLFHAVTDRALPMPWKALLTGFLASISVPIVLFIVAFTVIGVPLMFMLGLLWLVVLLLSGPVFGYYLGRMMLRTSPHPLLIMLAGGTLLIILYFIPILGFITMLAAVWIGSGMILLEIFNRTQKPVYRLTPVTAQTTGSKRTK